MTQDLVAFDLETTGLSPKADRIIEIGAVRFSLDGGGRRELQILVDPGMAVPLAVQRLTGIGDAALTGQPSPVEAVAQLADFCDGADLVGHGSVFDLAFCSKVSAAAFGRRDAMDTLELARILMPLAASHSLGRLSQALHLPHDRPHRALSDAIATAALFHLLLTDSLAIADGAFSEMRRVASQVESPLRRFFDLVTGFRADPGRVPASPVPAVAQPPAAEEETAAATSDGATPWDAEQLLHGSLADASARLIGPGGPLGEHPRYEYRQAQEQMTRAVAQSLERGGRLLVEAGTGVGKTLGYLVPLSLWVERGGGRAVVATNTVTLQEQLLDRDIPALQPLLPRPIRVAMLKGRSHHISLRRFRRYLRQSDVSARSAEIDTIRFKLKLLRWLELTRTGDRAELHLGGAERELWRHVESTRDDCLGPACANWPNGDCPMVAARRAAVAAELVVTNHALLLSDDPEEGGLLGEYSALVIDEAHHLEDSATRVGGHRLRGGDIALTVQRLPELVDALLNSLLQQSGEAAQRLFGEAKGLLTERLGGGEGAPTGSVALTDEVLDEPGARGLIRAAHHTITTLLRTAEALRSADPATSLALELLPQSDRGGEELAVAAASLESSAAAIDEILIHRRPGHVSWMELRAEQAELRDAPVSPGESLGDGLLDRARTTILTSATLAIAGDFGFIRERLGLRARTDELALSSPFDYLSQALCVLVTDIPPYDDPGYEPVLAALCSAIAERLGGRTIGLFTGYGALRRIRDLAARRLGGSQIATLGQGVDGTRRQLLASFQSNPRTLLLGTSTFWEGIDVPGDGLQCVIIAKLPFAVPTDPLVRARVAELRDPFGGYILPQAVIRLRQGFGRLIRSGRDRGVVVIADSRLQTRDYARRFLEALPPAAIFREPADLVAMRVADFVAAGGGRPAPEGGESELP